MKNEGFGNEGLGIFHLSQFEIAGCSLIVVDFQLQLYVCVSMDNHEYIKSTQIQGVLFLILAHLKVLMSRFIMIMKF